MTLLPAAIIAVLVGILLVGEYLHNFPLRAVSKTSASIGFCLFAWQSGALDQGSAGLAVLVALVLCAIGDVLLLWREKAPFLAGIIAFGLGHVGFAVAFALMGVGYWGVFLSTFALGPIAGVAWRLFGRKAGSLAPAVGGYIGIISLMVALAAGVVQADPSLPRVLLLLAAVLFFVSDLCVARDRFVRPGFENRIIGLPLYYGATTLFAWTIGQI